jgi:hypothetical protein
MAKNKVTVQLYGPGCETVHVALTKEAWEWWEGQDTEMLEQYTSAWDEDGYDFEVPKFADFNDGGAVFDADGMIDHYWRMAFEDGRLEINVNDKNIFTDPDNPEDEFYTPMLYDVADGDPQDDEDENIKSDTTWDDSDKAILNKMSEKKYMLTYESLEKGAFFDAEFEIDDEFDKSKLVVYTAEDWRTGTDLVTDIRYKDEDLDNEGGDSNGKGIYAYLWKHGE